MAKSHFAVEFTDTFGGEANYSWVNRATIAVLSPAPDNVYTSASGVWRNVKAFQRDVIKAAKAAMGLTGVKGRTIWHSAYGDAGVEFRPYGSCTIMFISRCDEPESDSPFC